MEVSDLKICTLGVEHLNTFVDMRMALFRELGEISNNEDITELITSTRHYFTANIGENLLCWGIIVDEKIVSVASLCLFSRIPYKENLSGKEGYILNVYTLPEYRGEGMAKALINTIINYAKTNNLTKLWLNSSEEGERVYKNYGFEKVENAMERPLSR